MRHGKWQRRRLGHGGVERDGIAFGCITTQELEMVFFARRKRECVYGSEWRSDCGLSIIFVLFFFFSSPFLLSVGNAGIGRRRERGCVSVGSVVLQK